MAFKKIDTPQAAFLKAGFFGFQGSGKTWTASRLAISLHQHIHSQKPIGFIDTETGSDFVYPLFKDAGIELQVDKSIAFKTLIEDMDAAVNTFDILIIDSITHFWREMLRAYKAAKRRTFISLKDWGPLKDEWHTFTSRYVNSRLHVLMCGRAANIFDDVEEEGETGKREFKTVRVGTKMSAETDTGYEPSLLVEMQKVFVGEGGAYVRRASVIKERFGVIDSHEFDFSPTDAQDYVFQCFLPHIKCLNLGGEHVGVDTSQTSAGLFESNGTSVSEVRKQQTVLSEEVEGLIVSLFPGQSAEEKKCKADVMQVAFGTRSWSAIKDLLPEKLREGKAVVEHLGFRVAKAREEQIDVPKARSSCAGWNGKHFGEGENDAKTGHFMLRFWLKKGHFHAEKRAKSSDFLGVYAPFSLAKFTLGGRNSALPVRPQSEEKSLYPQRIARLTSAGRGASNPWSCTDRTGAPSHVCALSKTETIGEGRLWLAICTIWVGADRVNQPVRSSLLVSSVPTAPPQTIPPLLRGAVFHRLTSMPLLSSSGTTRWPSSQRCASSPLRTARFSPATVSCKVSFVGRIEAARKTP